MKRPGAPASAGHPARPSTFEAPRERRRRPGERRTFGEREAGWCARPRSGGHTGPAPHVHRLRASVTCGRYGGRRARCELVQAAPTSACSPASAASPWSVARRSAAPGPQCPRAAGSIWCWTERATRSLERAISLRHEAADEVQRRVQVGVGGRPRAGGPAQAIAERGEAGATPRRARAPTQRRPVGALAMADFAWATSTPTRRWRAAPAFPAQTRTAAWVSPATRTTTSKRAMKRRRRRNGRASRTGRHPPRVGAARPRPRRVEQFAFARTASCTCGCRAGVARITSRTTSSPGAATASSRSAPARRRRTAAARARRSRCWWRDQVDDRGRCWRRGRRDGSQAHRTTRAARRMSKFGA